MSGTCTYDLAWVGKCKASCESDRCATHAAITCTVCKHPASHECSHTGQFVCGAPLCDNCEGFVDRDKEPGNWGFMNHGHRPKAAYRKVAEAEFPVLSKAEGRSLSSASGQEGGE